MKYITIIFCILLSFPPTIAKGEIYTGLVFDSKTKKPVLGAEVSIFSKAELIAKTTTDTAGRFTINSLASTNSIAIKIQKEGYKTFKQAIKIQNFKADTFFIEPLEYILPSLLIIKEKNIDYLNELHNYETTIEGKQLQMSISSTLGSTLRNTTDIFVRSMGPATSKPVFRGLGLEYFKAYENNIPVKDLSSTAPDHSTAIDPTIYDKIELVRGPKLLLLTNNPIGGIVNLTSRNYLTEQVQRISVIGTSIYESAYDSKLFNFKWEVPYKSFFSAGGVTLKNSHDMQSGKGLVQNTFSNGKTGNIYIGHHNDVYSLFIEGNIFDLDYGVPGGFVGAHPKGVNISLDKNTLNLKSLLHIHRLLDNIVFSFSRTYYHHVEYEKNNAIGAEFLFTNYYSDVKMNFQKFGILNESTFGITVENSNNDYGGYVFTPKVNSQLVSTYFYQNIRIGKHIIDYSLRFDHKQYAPKVDENFKKNPPISRNFNCFSFSVLVMHNFLDNSSLGFNFGRSERYPTIEELYSNGPHLASYSYEIGNSSLGKEEAYFGELSYNTSFNKMKFSSSIYWYEFPNYLFPQNTGKINVAQLLPIYQISNTNARFFGVTLNSEIDLTEEFFIKLDFSYSRGVNLTTSSNLPMIPPAKGKIEFNYNIKKLDITISNNFAFPQNKVGNFEEPTPGYTVFSANFRYPIYFDKIAAIINLSIDNIFNTTYYNHLSRIKSVFPEPGRNIRLLLSLYY